MNKSKTENVAKNTEREKQEHDFFMGEIEVEEILEFY